MDNVKPYRKYLDPLWEQVEGFESKQYQDTNNNPTIGMGANLNDSENLRRIAELGINEQEMDKQQARSLYEKTVSDKEKEFDAVRNEYFPTAQLAPNQEAALMSMFMNNANLIGPNVKQYLNEGNMDQVAREMLVNSNRGDVPGIQSRRLTEAKTFLGDGFSDYAKKLTPEERIQIRTNIENVKNEGERNRLMKEYADILGTTPDKYEYKRLNNLLKPMK